MIVMGIGIETETKDTGIGADGDIRKTHGILAPEELTFAHHSPLLEST